MHEEFFTLEEITTQTEAWADAFEAVNHVSASIKAIDLARYQQVLFMGCGSTYYLSKSAAALFQSVTGVICKAMPSSELMLFPETVFSGGRVLVVAISRSGTTSETLLAVNEIIKRDIGDVIVITNYSNSPLSKLGEISIVINKGQEKSVVQTRSFSSMYIAVTFLSMLFKPSFDFYRFKNDFILTGKTIISGYDQLARDLADNAKIKQVFFLGSGICYGLANEVSLKLKEMSQTHTQPYHFLEFRHGPISMIDSNTLVVGLISEKSRKYELDVLAEVKKYGAEVITIGESESDISFHSKLIEEVRGVFYLPVLQLFACYRAIKMGLNPDSPRQITSVVEINLTD